LKTEWKCLRPKGIYYVGHKGKKTKLEKSVVSINAGRRTGGKRKGKMLKTEEKGKAERLVDCPIRGAHGRSGERGSEKREVQDAKIRCQPPPGEERETGFVRTPGRGEPRVGGNHSQYEQLPRRSGVVQGEVNNRALAGGVGGRE